MTPILGHYMLSDHPIRFTQKATKVDEFLRWQTQFPGCGVNDDAQEGHTSKGPSHARHGIPKSVQSDNGPQFSAMEYSKFAKEWGFAHYHF